MKRSILILLILFTFTANGVCNTSSAGYFYKYEVRKDNILEKIFYTPLKWNPSIEHLINSNPSIFGYLTNEGLFYFYSQGESKYEFGRTSFTWIDNKLQDSLKTVTADPVEKIAINSILEDNKTQYNSSNLVELFLIPSVIVLVRQPSLGAISAGFSLAQYPFTENKLINLRDDNYFYQDQYPLFTALSFCLFNIIAHNSFSNLKKPGINSEHLLVLGGDVLALLIGSAIDSSILNYKNSHAFPKNAFLNMVKGTSVTSLEIWADLYRNGYINDQLHTSNKFKPDTEGFSLNINKAYNHYEKHIVEIMKGYL